MLSGAIFVIVGLWIDAPWWYFLLCGVQFLIGFIRFELASLEKEHDD